MYVEIHRHLFMGRENRKKLTTVHKANILKSTSGLFLKIAREKAQKYSQIKST